MAIKQATKKREETKHRGVFEKEPGTGIWWIQYFADGARKREKVGRKSDAIALYQQRKSEVRAGAKLPPNLRSKGETLGVVIGRALDWYTSHRPKNLRTVKGHLAVIKEDIGHRVVADLKPNDVDEWITEHKTWSDGTKNRYKTTLSRALQLEVIAGRLLRNVARLVTSRREHNTRVRWLKDDEEKRIIKAMEARCPEHIQSFLIAIHSGMRLSEQFSLTWNEIDFKRKKIFLSETKNGSDGEVPMNKTCVQAFTELWERRKALESEGKPVNEWVFQSRRDEGERLLNPRQWMEDILKDAKVKNFHWHDCRHTFCSRLVMRGVDLLTVSKLARHKSVAVTQRYAHLSPEHLANAVDVLDVPVGG